MLSLNYLPFEQALVELDEKITALQSSSGNAQALASLVAQKQQLLQKIYRKLTPWQTVQVARHPQRPHPNDLIPLVFSDIDALDGDRHSAKSQAIFGGLARLDEQPVMVIAHRKGRTIEENLACNFSCSQPQDFRKAKRLMELAEKFAIPVITLIDTKGAYPGIEAEENNQSEAIAANLLAMSSLSVPIISVVIGEGCSGGALGIGVADRFYMLEYSYYAVISPEGCASILWRDATRCDEAATILQLTAAELLSHQLIDGIIQEPLGSAYQDIETTAAAIKTQIQQALSELQAMSIERLQQQRYQKLRNIGV